MQRKQGCGIRYHLMNTFKINFQLLPGFTYDYITVRIISEPSSVKGLRIPYPLPKESTHPCDHPEISGLKCPIDQPYNHYSTKVQMGITGVLAAMTPSNEVVKLSLNFIGHKDGDAKDLGEITDIYVHVIKDDHPSVVANITTPINACYDVPEAVKPDVIDESTQRIEFKSLITESKVPWKPRTLQNMKKVAIFDVHENRDRRSFGNPKIRLEVNGESIDNPTNFPARICSYTERYQTCKFLTLDEKFDQEDLVKRRYFIDLPMIPENHLSYVEDDDVTYQLQGDNRRAYGRVTMKLNTMISKSPKSDTGKAIVALWNPNIEYYQRKIDEKLKSSSVLITFSIAYFLAISSL